MTEEKAEKIEKKQSERIEFVTPKEWMERMERICSRGGSFSFFVPDEPEETKKGDR